MNLPRRYPILVSWSPDDQLYVAEVPDLPGCMAHGETRPQAYRNARDAMELYVDDLLECGEPLPDPQTNERLSA